MTTIHRLLDDAFAGIPLSPDVQDLKEEMRANLSARAAELEAAGATPDAAAHRAFDELGDLSELVTGLGASASTGAEAAGREWTQWERHRVRPRPAFAVRTTVLSVVAGMAALVILGILAGFPDSYASLASVITPALVIAAIVLPVTIGVIVGDALHQETSSHFPMPSRRAAAFGIASALVLGAVTTALVFFHEPAASGWPLLVVASILLLAGIGIFAYAGSTQTNRTKPWARDLEAQYVLQQPDRFTTDHAAAARFGLYTAVIWVVAIIVFVVVGILGYWAWSWLALGAAVALMLLILARMLFGDSTEHKD